MSRNFEVLQRLQQFEPSLNATQGAAAAAASTPAPAGPGLAVIDPQLIASLDGISQEIFKLVDSVFSGTQMARVVMFSGVHQTEKSFICPETAEVLAAQVTGTVCIVDANLRAPSLHTYFDLPNTAGLADALVQNDSIDKFVQRVENSRVWALAAGVAMSDTEAVLSSEAMRARVTELRNMFDYLLICAPPVVTHAETISMGRLVDGIVLIIEANSTRREHARRAKENLERANIRLLGAVLNDRRFPIPQGLYSRL